MLRLTEITSNVLIVKRYSQAYAVGGQIEIGAKCAINAINAIMDLIRWTKEQVEVRVKMTT